ncbi:MAG TPA: hypothetical protein VNC15_05345, partial [Solirubrobacterales bacterium]|nr:hypothetical protein [Solirubrobacterales bacterium]
MPARLSTPSRGFSGPAAKVTLAVTTLLAGLALVPSTSQARYTPANGWCGPPKEADWVCGWKGASFLTPPGGSEQALPLRSALSLPARSRVKAAPGGTARLTFRAKAHCTVGGKGADWSEAVTRWEPGVLMRQISGDSSCTIRGRSAPITTFCEDSEVECPVRIRARGTFLLQGLEPHSEALASSESTVAESIERHARLVICDGAVQVTVEGEAEEAFGRADG